MRIWWSRPKRGFALHLFKAFWQQSPYTLCRDRLKQGIKHFINILLLVKPAALIILDKRLYHCIFTYFSGHTNVMYDHVTFVIFCILLLYLVIISLVVLQINRFHIWQFLNAFSRPSHPPPRLCGEQKGHLCSWSKKHILRQETGGTSPNSGLL